VGAGSLRRESALGELRPDLVPTLVRGNVPTRVNKTVEGVVQALVIARAGLARLQLDPTPLLAFDLDPTVWIPAPGQATVSAEVRAGDATTSQIVRSIDHADTRRCVEIERRLLALAGGGCHTAFAAWVRSIGNGDVEAHVGTPDANGAWVRRAFRGDGDEVLRAARQWFEGDRGRGDAPVAGEETCRPARPWC